MNAIHTSNLWDAVVVGAGPAGAMAALELATRGRRVLLVERSRWPRYKVCGCCLNRSALDVLDRAGIDLSANSESLSRFHVAASGRTAEIALPGGRVWSRESMDAALAGKAVSAGAAFCSETTATHVYDDADGVTLRLRARDSEQHVRARVVLAAGGLGSARACAPADTVDVRVAPDARIGAGTVLNEAPSFYEAGTIYMACGTAGYAGLVRLPDQRLNIAAALDPSFVKECGGLAAAVSAIVHEAGFPVCPELSTARWKGTPALTRQVHPVADGRCLMLGDAAGYVEPFTGEGMAWALKSGVAAGELVAQAGEMGVDAVASRWSAWYRENIARERRVCHTLAWMLRRPWLVKAFPLVLAAAPAVAKPFVHRIYAPLKQQRKVVYP